MAGFINGPVGHVVGIGLQAAIGGIPISPGAEKAINVMRTVGLPVPAKNWFCPKSEKESGRENLNNAENDILEVYDNVAANLRDAIKNLTPAMAEIKGAMRKGSKSAEPPSRKTQEPEVVYYSPQNSHSSNKGCPCKLQEKKSSKSENVPSSKSSTTNFAVQNVHKTSSLKVGKGEEKKSCSKSSQKVCSKKSSKDNNDKENKKSSGQIKKCSKCGINIDVVKMFGLLVCGHALCPDCLPQKAYNNCPVCNKTLITKTVMNSHL